MTDANQVDINFLAETIFGQTPAAGRPGSLRFNSEGLVANYNDEESPEIRSDRNFEDIIQLGTSNGGDIATYLSYGNLDEFMAANLYDRWRGATNTDAGLSVTAPGAGANGGTVDNLTKDLRGRPADVAGLMIMGAVAAGVDEIDIDGGTGGEMLGAGAVIQIAGDTARYIVTADNTAVAGVYSDVAISPPLQTAAADNAAVAFVSDALAVGDWALVDGFATAANSGWFRISAFAADSVTFDGPGTMVTEAASAGDKRVRAVKIANQVERTTFTVEKVFRDARISGGPLYHRYIGMLADAVAYEFRTEAAATASLTLTGKEHNAANASVFGARAPLPTTTGRVISSALNVGRLAQDNEYLEDNVIVQSITCNVSNTIRANRTLGQIGPADLSAGRCRVEGTLEVYFRDGSLYDKLLSREDISLSWEVSEDPDEPENGNTYLFSMPRARLRQGRIVVGGVDTDLVAQFDYQGLRHADFGHSISIARAAK